ncbi:MAG: aminotransferase class IV [Christensenellaceae bacterium]|jgi:D-alanine transaminase
MKNLGYYNGEIGLIEEMKIPMNDRACYFGDGVYEATRVTNNIMFFVDQHIDRLYNNAARIEINIPYPKEKMKETLQGLVEQVDAKEKVLYWQVSRGTATRKHAFVDGAPNLYATVRELPLTEYKKPVSLVTTPDTRFLHCDIKTINLLLNVLAAEKAEKAGAYEAVFHRGDRVTECSHSNVSILKDGVFRTAQTDEYILPGITRAHLLRICKKLGIPTIEEAFTLEELFDADEVIVSSSTNFCVRATKLDGIEAGGKDEALFFRIQDEIYQEYFEIVGV